jgi:hypothetical protein
VPGQERVCQKCDKVGHYARCCKSTPSTAARGGGGKHTSVNYIRKDDIDSKNPEDPQYAFTLHEDEDTEDQECKVDITMGGVILRNVLVDSDASVNIIDRVMWEYMKKEKAKCMYTKYRKHVYPYGSNRPLPTLEKFEAWV